ncbi:MULTISPECIES: tRNA uracil 4-sulfurtransferase ThiI [unclassified Mycoplasma]|uniref:tRNA uracil 4-sulfurtransferase ThiI n=1 Tax=unclassified Mycoplasma TaxID=2683645 RepID=UPI002B1DDF1E|nr:MULTISPECIES: tRNA uracil 4-sulfurtransferase ThiI [unclassified Mycoplasma]MEA4191153.1 tRNA uracil 4-sulfurtransferase ThiI [Mycoplasma sp. 2248]MEA4206240.1 tRNA uracil 4-sulfurtransferase ThiI [Mycoplasma sp. 1199]
MYSKILIRYGELVLKKKNRKQFINQLAINIKHIVGVTPEVEFDRMYLPYSEENMNNLNYVFGISSYSPVMVVENDMEVFANAVLSSIRPDSKTFKIAARRNYKKFEFSSDQINNYLGGVVLKNTNLKVDVHNPDQTFYVEVRNGKTYIFSDYTKGLGGLPVGVSGKVLHLISGGFDSPVAAWQMMKRGLKVDFLTFITPPQTDIRTVEKITNLVKVLNKYQVTSNLLIADYSHLMNYISFVSKESYKITLMRRSFYRIAEQIAQKYNQQAISNGDNLGQVASQTIESLSTIGEATRMQILRPLLTYDKNDIIDIARKIGTENISIIKANETCELFAPKEPVTKPTIQEALRLENELENIEELEQELLNSKIELVKVKK